MKHTFDWHTDHFQVVSADFCFWEMECKTTILNNFFELEVVGQTLVLAGNLGCHLVGFSNYFSSNLIYVSAQIVLVTH